MNQWKVVCVAVLSLFLASCKDPTMPAVFQQSAVHIRPSWSNDGTTIAFSAVINNVSGIYLVDSSGSNLHLLAENTAVGCSWSPDSKWLVFRDGDYNLYEIMANGDSLKQLTRQASDLRPAWSLDGNRIAFERYGLGICVLDIHTLAVTSVFANASYPTWHPNGDIVGLGGSASASIDYNAYTFYAIQPDSLTWHTLTSFVSSGITEYPVVRPTGTSEGQVAYGLTPSSGYSEIWLTDFGTGVNTQLTGDGADFPAWSPDGSKIVYTRTQVGDGALWIMNADGSGKHRLTSPTN